MIDPEKIRELILSFEEAAKEARAAGEPRRSTGDWEDLAIADTYRVCARKLRELVEH